MPHKDKLGELEKPICPECGRPLCTGDCGWYCDNKECNLFDVDIPAMGACSECGVELTKENMWSEMTCRNCAIKLGLADEEIDALAVEQEGDGEELCNECGRNVAGGSGLFVDRVPSFSTIEERIEMGKPYPKGAFICRECEEKIQKEQDDGGS